MNMATLHHVTTELDGVSVLIMSPKVYRKEKKKNQCHLKSGDKVG